MALSPTQYAELTNLFLEVDESGVELDARSLKFYNDQKQRYEFYKDRIILSEAQWKWLNDIHAKATK